MLDCKLSLRTDDSLFLFNLIRWLLITRSFRICAILLSFHENCLLRELLLLLWPNGTMTSLESGRDKAGLSFRLLLFLVSF